MRNQLNLFFLLKFPFPLKFNKYNFFTTILDKSI